MTRIIDLHNLELYEALNVAEIAINEGIVQQEERLDLIHGIGDGILKKELHSMLENYSNVIERFELDPLNPGRTKVFF